MADTLKASKQGLLVVDRARRRKGWTKTRTPAWWDAAYTTQATLKRFWRGIAIQRENFIAICQAVGLRNWEAIAEGVEARNGDISLGERASAPPLTEFSEPLSRIDWGEAPDLPFFYGRDLELQKLERWIVGDRCKLVTLLGMGGTGKTSLAVTLVERLGEQFECVWWRSLLGAPPLDFLLESLIQFVSQGRETLASQNRQRGITQAIALLSRHRCLLVLDEAEAILGGGGGRAYRPGYEGYGDFLKRAGSDRHQSCILLTSREKPSEIVAYEGQMLPVRSLQLGGLKREEALHLLKTKGLSASDGELSLLTDFYSGNPLALKTIATTIQDLFNGNIGTFLHQNTLVLGDRLRGLLAQQFGRLSKEETEVLYWLALDPEPLSVERLHAHLLFPPSRSQLLETLAALERRSLIDKISHESQTLFTLQPLVMKYASENFTQQSLEEIQAVLDNRDIGLFRVLKTHAPLPQSKVTQKRYPSVRIFSRLAKALQSTLGCDRGQIAEQLSTLLPLLHGQPPQTVGYLGSNLKALLQALSE
ncbi:MAG: NB-ARC domain-containing protein [Cyanobacteriota bacterium]|nr:NB-ARC domain-containing protein [Cyanobacteriota bacterium]